MYFLGREVRRMQKDIEQVVFLCPKCQKTFEFDRIGEHQIVQCPICNIHLVSVTKKGALTLQFFEQYELGCLNNSKMQWLRQKIRGFPGDLYQL
jgi:ribosomal protein L37AE/L43A